MKKLSYILLPAGLILFLGVLGDFENEGAAVESMMIRAVMAVILISCGAVIILHKKKSP